jgi:hypothetical protein
MKSMGARLAAASILAGMLLVYYGTGVGFQIWPDSGGYLLPALGLAGEVPFTRSGARSIGYPAFVAIALLTPAPLLVLVLAQAALSVAAFIGLYVLISRVALPALVPDLDDRRPLADVLVVGVTAATLYSIVHVQIAAVLTETLFIVLALASVGAAIWFCRLEPGACRPWRATCFAMGVIGANLTVKPHWIIAAFVLATVVAIRLWQLVDRPEGPRHRRRLAAVLLPFFLLALWSLPDRLLAVRYPDPGDALFGPRTAFCNHMPLIRATLARRPTFVLADDAQFESELRDRMQLIADRRETGWSLLGFNGDSCTFDAQLSTILNRFRPDPAVQARFLTGALIRAVLTDPLPFAAKFSRQMLFGFTTAFQKFAHHAMLEPIDLRSITGTDALGAALQRAVTTVASVGPLGSREALKNTHVGRGLHGLLAVYFFTLTGLLCGLAVVTILAPVWLWRGWGGPTRKNFVVFLAVPLAVILAHHAVVALTHSFDVWRYGFNMFFVNLLFIATSGSFWLSHLAAWRRVRATSAPRA